jgi:hypothetical protein
MIIVQLISILVVDGLHVIFSLLFSILVLRHSRIMLLSLEFIIGALLVLSWLIWLICLLLE